MKFEKVRIDVLSPVHIGTGDTLDPFSYIMKEMDGNPWLFTVDLTAWIDDHPNPEELTNKFSNSPFHSVRSFVRENVDVSLYAKSKARATSEIYNKYRQKLSDPANQLKIAPALKNAYNHALIIPGSSIKGAIRTAIIDYLDREYKLGLKEISRNDDRWSSKYYKKLESIFGEIKENDLKHLKTGDFEAKRDESFYVAAKEISRNTKKVDDPRKSNTPKDDCEVAFNRLMCEEPYSMHGKIGIGEVSKKECETLSLNKGQEKFTLVELMDLCSEFYINRYEEERGNFYSRSQFARTEKSLKLIDDEILNRKKGEMVLRIGHYSHIECMTISNNAPQTQRTKNGKFFPYGTTRTLANGTYPFGWVKLSVCSEEEYNKAFDEKEKHDTALEREYLAGRLNTRKERDRIAQEKMERERQIRQKAEKEARQKAELEAMPEGERMIHLLMNGKLSESDAVAFFNKLDEIEGDVKLEAASAFKNYWQVSGKWAKKDCSKKQFLKVKKIKEILGEL